MSKFKKYEEYFKIGFRESIEYKWDIFGTILDAFISIFIFIVVWNIIYELNNTTILNGFIFQDLILYFIIFFSFSLLKDNPAVYEISDKIKSGDLSIYLSKPVNFIYSLFFVSLGRLSINLFIYLILMIGLIFYSFDNLNLSLMVLFFIYSFFLLFFYILLNIFIATFSFMLTEIWGLTEAVNQFIKIFSGYFFPLSFFPPWFISILSFTPFLYLEYQLTLIFLNKIPITEIFLNLGILIFWSFVLCLFIYLNYKKGLKNVNINGG